MRTFILIGLMFVACDRAPAPGPQQPAPAGPTKPAEVYPTPDFAPQRPDSWGTTSGMIDFHPVQHATLWMQVGDRVVWVDPWSKAKLEGPKADIVLITDLHGDHFDAEGLAAVRGSGGGRGGAEGGGRSGAGGDRAGERGERGDRRAPDRGGGDV
jgi:hypothetical protein